MLDLVKPIRAVWILFGGGREAGLERSMWDKAGNPVRPASLVAKRGGGHYSPRARPKPRGQSLLHTSFPGECWESERLKGGVSAQMRGGVDAFTLADLVVIDIH